MQAAELFDQKIKPTEVARRLRVSAKSAYQWHQLWPDSSRCGPAPAPGTALGVAAEGARRSGVTP